MKNEWEMKKVQEDKKGKTRPSTVFRPCEMKKDTRYICSSLQRVLDSLDLELYRGYHFTSCLIWHIQPENGVSCIHRPLYTGWQKNEIKISKKAIFGCLEEIMRVTTPLNKKLRWNVLERGIQDPLRHSKSFTLRLSFSNRFAATNDCLNTYDQNVTRPLRRALHR